ncbi:hypothetical protein ACRYCC_24205 [Actinomadura scrupuli]|uniref:hypothetical protein n=1 Tax=Actinomadura scrupuli TaxID=559629 RepID=UPI003D991C2C
MVSGQDRAVGVTEIGPNGSVPRRKRRRSGLPGLSGASEQAGTATGHIAEAFLPAPAPTMVRAARAYLTPRYAVGVDQFLWETKEHPLPDLDAIDAIIDASDRAQEGTGDQPPPMAVAAALVVLGAARLNIDQTEARLLDAAQAAGMGWEQIAAILDLSAEAAEERHRRLKPRIDEPAADVLPPHPRDRATHRPRIAVNTSAAGRRG